MTSEQYEELCRLFLSSKFELPIEQILSVSVPNARRPGLPEYRHQIDLYWETGNELAAYLHIANAKWRTTDKVDQPDVLLLQQVKQKVGAHKAIMITSTGFTAGAMAVAEDDGIALHVVVPSLSVTSLPTGDRTEMQRTLTSLASSSNEPLYTYRIEHRAHEQVPLATPLQPSTVVRPSALLPNVTARVVAVPNSRVVGPQVGSSAGAGTGIQTRGSGPAGKGGGSGHKR